MGNEQVCGEVEDKVGKLGFVAAGVEDSEGERDKFGELALFLEVNNPLKDGERTEINWFDAV